MFDSGMKLDQPKQDQLKHVKIPEIHTMGVLGGELYVIGGDGVSQVIKAGFQIAALEHVKISENRNDDDEVMIVDQSRTIFFQSRSEHVKISEIRVGIDNIEKGRELTHVKISEIRVGIDNIEKGY